jgi:hypothetical protein
MNPPKRGKKYWEIVNRGCGGTRDYWGEYDCKHPYNWTCDDCPVCIEYQKHRPLAVDEGIFTLEVTHER